MHTEPERRWVVLVGGVMGIVRYTDLAANPPGLKIPELDKKSTFEACNLAGGWLDVHKAPVDALMATMARLGKMIIEGDLPAEDLMRMVMPK